MALLLGSSRTASAAASPTADMDRAAMAHWLVGALADWRQRVGGASLPLPQQRQLFRDAFRLYLEHYLPSGDASLSRLPRSVRDQLARYHVLQHLLRRYLRDLASPAEQRLLATLRIYARREVDFCDDYALAVGLLTYLHATSEGWPAPSVPRTSLTFHLATDEQTGHAAACVARLACRIDRWDTQAQLPRLAFRR